MITQMQKQKSARMYEHSDAEKKLVEQEIKRIERSIWDNQNIFSNPTIESGCLGPSLFYSYLWLYTGNKDYLMKAELFLEKGFSLVDVNRFKRVYSTDSLDNHIAQVGRFLEFVKMNEIMNVDADETLQSFDLILLDLMRSKINIGDFDIQSGALAAGYYYLSRTTNKEHTAEYLAMLIKGIEDKAVIDASGNYSWVSPSLKNRTYLGISHGSALIISFVCNVYERGIEKQLCTRVLNKASSFLLGFKTDFGKGLFPTYVENDEPGHTQFSLCYGDLGIGYALLRMGILLQDDQILTIATEILHDCTGRRKEDNRTFDASLTYGAGGVATCFEKLHAITGTASFLDSAQYWYSKIPEYNIHSNQFAGYKSRVSVKENGIWDINFAWGITGVGTALIKYLAPNLPSLAPLLLIA